VIDLFRKYNFTPTTYASIQEYGVALWYNEKQFSTTGQSMTAFDIKKAKGKCNKSVGYRCVSNAETRLV